MNYKNSNYYFHLSKIFSPKILKELSKNGTSSYLLEILKNTGLYDRLDLEKNLNVLFDDIYKVLNKKYRNEYIYKNTIIRKILLSKHSINTANLINECVVGNSKADCVIFNGTSTVYEIKSEFDSFYRLDKQLQDYQKAFEFIFVVVPEKSVEKILKYLESDYIGIMTLNNNGTLTTIREAKSNKTNFDKEMIFNLLRRDEYVQIIEKYFEKLPEIPNTRIYDFCKKSFLELDIEIIHNNVIKLLKNRRDKQCHKDLVKEMPKSLKALSIQINFTKREKDNLLKLFSKELKYIL